MNFDGKVIVITGATGGLGRALCQALSSYSCKLLITDINSQKLSDLKNELKENKNDSCIIEHAVMDVANEEEVINASKDVKEKFGQVNVLINNAGYLHYNNIFELAIDEWDKVLNINLRGVFLTSKYFGSYMKEQKSGKIVNISSVAAISGVQGGGAYSSSKSGLLGLTRVLAKEFAPYNINVNSISPGPIDGEFLNNNSDDKGRQMRIENTLFKRIGEYNDIVSPVLFMASNEANWITGQNLFVDGGYTV